MLRSNLPVCVLVDIANSVQVLSCSRVRDTIDDLEVGLVLAQLFLVDSSEVTWQTLRLHRVHNWSALLNTFGSVSVYKAEIFECLRIRRREFEVSWDVPREPKPVTLDQTNCPSLLDRLT